VDLGPRQRDDFCPSHITNDELFDLQSQIVIKRYRCATTRLPVQRINENIYRLTLSCACLVWGTDTNTFSLCEFSHLRASLLPPAPFSPLDFQDICN
jgi:hypothetical protein